MLLPAARHARQADRRLDHDVFRLPDSRPASMRCRRAAARWPCSSAWSALNASMEPPRACRSCAPASASTPGVAVAGNMGTDDDLQLHDPGRLREPGVAARRRQQGIRNADHRRGRHVEARARLVRGPRAGLDPREGAGRSRWRSTSWSARRARSMPAAATCSTLRGGAGALSRAAVERRGRRVRSRAADRSRRRPEPDACGPMRALPRAPPATTGTASTS